MHKWHWLPCLLLAVAPISTHGAHRIDAALLDAFVQLEQQVPPLELARAAARDGMVLPLTKTVARADGVTLGVVASELEQATDGSVRQAFARYADQFLGRGLLQLPKRAGVSPQAPGLIEFRISREDGTSFLLAWRSDTPFAALAVAAEADLCSRLLPPFDPGVVPEAAHAGLQRRQVYTRLHQNRSYQRTSSWQLREQGRRLAWVLLEDSCQDAG